MGIFRDIFALLQGYFCQITPISFEVNNSHILVNDINSLMCINVVDFTQFIVNNHVLKSWYHLNTFYDIVKSMHSNPERPLNIVFLSRTAHLPYLYSTVRPVILLYLFCFFDSSPAKLFFVSLLSIKFV